ncbi:uncharacterized protein N7482_009934 [Penicillium canariense]|uniref:Uncharacterized protein n=1 Tax=Penicillium canariense TaxID=189055 RepID=A0A9W9LFE9_9EURO|nr:uncharacterized protein N7482_009934 [Penicillium canariense]KAJ5153456.1 hypothetical protein N7482_009934 [Penicillium canariense]
MTSGVLVGYSIAKYYPTSEKTPVHSSAGKSSAPSYSSGWWPVVARGRSVVVCSPDSVFVQQSLLPQWLRSCEQFPPDADMATDINLGSSSVPCCTSGSRGKKGRGTPVFFASGLDTNAPDRGGCNLISYNLSTQYCDRAAGHDSDGPDRKLMSRGKPDLLSIPASGTLAPMV